ncbi:fasciclin domain-containing protein [Gracilimonas halophila]|uniref:Fasciclin domain-containing protein n=1 Tax=Gracilimonas halophila TaxID=1834464 RepID=A0ABW5JIT0_9BACT
MGTFTSLVGAVDQVGLTSTLKYKGDFTVFAPTDDAFASLPDGLLASLTNEQVTEILTYHVLSGEVFSNQLDPEQAVESLSEEDVFITSNNDGVFVNGSASVVTADVDVSNGVIHAIDAVILPNEFLDVVQIAQKNYNLTTLVDLVVDADLVTTLKGDGPFTVLAPTNAAFAEISATLDGLTASEVEEVLLYHVAAQEALAGDLTDGMTIETVQGEDITVTIDAENNVFFNGDVGVVTVDLEGTNGVVHIIDGVLIPPSFTN